MSLFEFLTLMILIVSSSATVIISFERRFARLEKQMDSLVSTKRCLRRRRVLQRLITHKDLSA